MDSLDQFAKAKLVGLESRSLRRRLTPTRSLEGAWVERDGRRMLSFSSNDYLGLSHHPKVIQVAADAALAYGAGAGASRLVTGDHPLLAALEAKLAALKGTEACCLFGSGYLANTGLIPSLVGEGDLVLIDALAHACLWAGAKLSGARVIPFPHNDLEALEQRLIDHRGQARHALIATDGVFSMDGDLAPLDCLSILATAHDAWLLADDAHGLGVVGEGRGSAAAFPGAQVPLQMGTLSKALGSYGGYVCASQPVVDLLKTRARTLIYSTALPASAPAAALAALEIMAAEPERVAAPVERARQFTRALNLPRAMSAIVPVVIGEADAALACSRALADQGLLVVAIRPPTVPAGTARLRVAFTADHTPADVDRLAAAIAPMLQA
ncbi:MAG: 8-amino-7-oxononanoate synthase [Caulobacteraceae bacterium]|nr:8-amino-7-oxononanoate synthase [Caulobacteraceae bacterium]